MALDAKMKPATLTRKVAAVFGSLAAVFLAGMMLLTVADVVLRHVFAYPIRGMLELVELGLACTVFLALPAVFLRDENLVVDVVDHLAPRGMVQLLDLAGAVVSLGVLVVMAWQMAPLAKAMVEFGDVTSDLSIPKLYYWIPVLLGVVASALATVVFIARWRPGR
ncbi:MAG: TRAP transporter small permease [Betaproteobacteria bacterium]